MPREELPSSFHENVMYKIQQEALKIKKRNEWLGLFSVSIASVLFIALAIFAIIYIELPRIDWPMMKLTSIPFYSYIGILALFLLFADHRFRRAYKKKHEKDI